jgi:hypothetical protein
MQIFFNEGARQLCPQIHQAHREREPELLSLYQETHPGIEF